MGGFRSRKDGSHYPLKGGKKAYPDERWIKTTTRSDADVWKNPRTSQIVSAQKQYEDSNHPELIEGKYMVLTGKENGKATFLKKNVSKTEALAVAKKYMQEKWIQGVTEEKEFKGGSLRERLDIPADKTIPKTLEQKIVDAPIGTTIKNPTKTGKKQIKVTKKLKAKANFALNIRPD